MNAEARERVVSTPRQAVTCQTSYGRRSLGRGPAALLSRSSQLRRRIEFALLGRRKCPWDGLRPVELTARRRLSPLPWPQVPRPTIAALSRSSVDVLPRRSPYGKTRLCGGMWVLLDMSTKRRGLYITYTPTRAADGSDGERTPWDAMSRRGKGVKSPPDQF